jgi:hypothetical protein
MPKTTISQMFPRPAPPQVFCCCCALSQHHETAARPQYAACGAMASTTLAFLGAMLLHHSPVVCHTRVGVSRRPPAQQNRPLHRVRHSVCAPNHSINPPNKRRAGDGLVYIVGGTRGQNRSGGQWAQVGRPASHGCCDRCLGKWANDYGDLFDCSSPQRGRWLTRYHPQCWCSAIARINTYQRLSAVLVVGSHADIVSIMLDNGLGRLCPPSSRIEQRSEIVDW